MAFHLYVDTPTRLHGFRELPDSERHHVEDLITKREAGLMPLDRTVDFGHGVTLRWCDVKDIWIEEA